MSVSFPGARKCCQKFQTIVESNQFLSPDENKLKRYFLMKLGCKSFSKELIFAKTYRNKLLTGLKGSQVDRHGILRYSK